MLVTRSCPTPCNPMDCSLCPWNSPGKNTGVGLPFPSGGVPDPGIEPVALMFPALAGGFFTTSATGKWWEGLSEIGRLYHQKQRETKEPLDESERGE